MAARYDVEGLVVVIAGGTTGLGLSAAKQLVEQGAKLAIFGRSQDSVDAAVAELGHDTLGFALDATDPDSTDVVIEAAVQRFGRLDALYHVAGGSGRKHGDGPLHELTDDGWRFTCDLNLSSMIWSNRAAVRQFLKQGAAARSSTWAACSAGRRSRKHFASHGYAATKAAPSWASANPSPATTRRTTFA
jgi:NAD(P)-dependent dehydrogenase (short-subunit alcohol dehydrogenase family)